MTDARKPLTIEINAQQLANVRAMLNGPRALRGASVGLRTALSEMERHHKTAEMIRGSETAGGRYSSAIADPSRVTSRTGNLSRSYRIYHERGSLVGYYGSTMRRARMLEEGGTIKPVNGRMLAIPSAYARVGRGAAPWPKDQPPGLLFRIGRVLYKAKTYAKRSDLIPMYYLVPQVTIKPRPGLRRTAEATGQRSAELIMADVLRAMGAEGSAP